MNSQKLSLGLLGIVQVCVPLLAMLLLSTAPVSGGEATVASSANLSTQVTIRRDRYGVPHILAETEAAAAYGHGYASAEDHVLLLARIFLQARGEEAAHFGAEFAGNDFTLKQFRVHETAKVGYQKSPPWVRAIFDGYAAGYNRYIEKNRAALPEWVQPISPVDVMARGRRVLFVRFALDRGQIERIGRRAAVKPDSALQPDGGKGSNMWAIAPKKSASGKAILLGNPHLNWHGSDVFYEAHLTVPGKINISGCSLVGSPCISIGFNEHLGWSHTVNAHDSDDIYELTLNPENPHQYQYDGQWLPIEEDSVEIRIKTSSGHRIQKRTVQWCHYGPVVKRIDNKAYAVKSANQDEYRFVEQWYLMGKARNLAEFRQALDMQALPMFNICYADKEGNIFYLFNGRFPDRPSGYDWSGIVPGNTSATEWNHILPQRRLPFLMNPPAGYVQNCNSAPWYTTHRLPLDRRNYPDGLTRNNNNLRTQHSVEMLAGDNNISLEEVLKYKYTTKLLIADRIKPDLIEYCKGRQVEGVDLTDAVNLLRNWDNCASRDSRAAMLFINFARKYEKMARKFYAENWTEWKPFTTPRGIGDSDAARKALAAAVTDMTDKYGTIAVRWGDIHRMRRGKLDIEIGGEHHEFGAFRILQYKQDKDGKFIPFGGDSYVLAVEFSSPPKAHSIMAYSQSDDPKSPHHNDQSALFAREKWKRAWFTEEDIKRNLVREYRP